MEWRIKGLPSPLIEKSKKLQHVFKPKKYLKD